jgi:hypothetical protein
MRYLIGVFALVLALGVTLSAQAKVQNVKVGGDVQIRSISRSDWNLKDDAANKDNQSNDASWYDSAVRLQISADLTNGVGAVVRLINERDWDAANNNPNTSQNLQLDLGYITLNNMFGYPLKATLGRQEILFGEGFLIGDGYNGVTVASPGYGYQQSNIAYGGSIRSAFDALRLTYTAQPYTVDLFTAKINDNLASSPTKGDDTLSGINIKYSYLDVATFGLGYFVNQAGATSLGLPTTKNSQTQALSLRGEGSIPSVPGLTVKGDYVWESGNVIAANGVTERDLDANGWYAGAKYTLQDNLYQPYLGATYVFMSGNDNATGDYKQFDSLYSAYEDYGTIASLKGFNQTNLKAWKIVAGLKPTEALSLDLAYAILKRDKTAASVDDALGNELDASLTYDYTEDVQFGLSAAWFDPGQNLQATGDSNATQVVGSVTVSF